MKHPFCSALLLLTISLSSIVSEASERLYYHLSYSGLITGFFWKKLADVTLNLEPEAVQFRDEQACRLSMAVDTTHYTFAEMIHPVRYRWESTLSPSLQQTLLARATDSGKSKLHEVAWYDWDRGEITLFRNNTQARQMDGPDAAPVTQHEPAQAIPPFIHPQGSQPDSAERLIQSAHFKTILQEPAIDPLAMIQRARNHHYGQADNFTMQVLLDEELHQYHARLSARPALKIGGTLYPSTLKIEIRRTSKKGRAGAMHLWLSDDSKRLPLRIDIEAPLGMIHLALLHAEQDSTTPLCTAS